MLMADFVEVQCWKCDVRYCMTRTLNDRRQRDGEAFFCPNGHSAVYRDSDMDKLRRERDRLKQQIVERDDEIAAERGRREAAERSAAAHKGIATRLKVRAAGGVCPCCTRSFENLRRHIALKHPGFGKPTELSEVAS
jgi:hypothetical protein